MSRAAVALAVALATAASAQPARLAGRVTDAETGAPVVGAAVVVEAGRQWGHATDADGRFSMDGLPTAAVAVRVTALGYAPFDTTLAPPAWLEVRLMPRVYAEAEVLVEGRRAETATRADAPVRLVPQAVAVIPSAILEAQAARTAPDALRNVPGVAVRARGEPGAVPVLRGFETDRTGGGVRRNGIEMPYLSDGLRANVERVEVLRGPASVLYGRLEPGGVVNFITERPEGRVRGADAEGGTLGSARLAVDVGERVGERGAVRVNAEAERADAGRDRTSGTTLFLAPAVRWRPTDRLVLDADAEAVEALTVFDPGLAGPGAGLDALDAVPASRSFGEPTARHRWRSLGAFTAADWAASERLGVRGTLSLARYHLRRDHLALDSLTTTASGPAVARSLKREGLAFTYLKGTSFADLRLRSGPVVHAVTLGAEAIRVWAQADGDAPLVSQGDALRFALIDPVALDDPTPTGLRPEDDVTYLDASVHGLDLGTFVQDRASVPLGAATLHAVGAIRLSHVRYGATIVALADTPDAPAGISKRSAQVTAVTPSAGLVLEPRTGLALYASVGTSFNPIVERVDRDGEPFLPTRGLQVEGGLKAEASWASATVAAFWLRKDDALTQGPGGFYDQTGRQRSQGVEVEARVAGRGVVALATYAFLDAEVIEDDNVAPGTPLPYAPRHAASLWAEGRRGRLALRGGVWAQGERSGALGGTLTLPASATVDLGAEWTVRPGLTVRLDARNVLGARAYTAADARGEEEGPGSLLVAWPAPARELRLGVVVR